MAPRKLSGGGPQPAVGSWVSTNMASRVGKSVAMPTSTPAIEGQTAPSPQGRRTAGKTDDSLLSYAMAGGGRSDLGGTLGLAVLRLSRRLRQEAGWEVSQSQVSVLAVLAQAGELTLGELAATERIAPPSITRTAAWLERSGLIERRPDTTDRRVARVALSHAGERLLQVYRARGDAFLSTRLESLTEEECAVLSRAVPLLERLASEQVPKRFDRTDEAHRDTAST